MISWSWLSSFCTELSTKKNQAFHIEAHFRNILPFSKSTWNKIMLKSVYINDGIVILAYWANRKKDAFFFLPIWFKTEEQWKLASRLQQESYASVIILNDMKAYREQQRLWFLGKLKMSGGGSRYHWQHKCQTHWSKHLDRTRYFWLSILQWTVQWRRDLLKDKKIICFCFRSLIPGIAKINWLKLQSPTLVTKLTRKHSRRLSCPLKRKPSSIRWKLTILHQLLSTLESPGLPDFKHPKRLLKHQLLLKLTWERMCLRWKLTPGGEEENPLICLARWQLPLQLKLRFVFR